jgi:hypothetical protein
MKCEDITHQIGLKQLHILACTLAAHELAPRFEQVLDRYDIVVCVREHDPTKSFHSELLPLLQRIKTLYLLWYEYYQTLPKIHRHTLGKKIDALFIELMEAVNAGAFLPRDQKLPYVRLAIRKQDTLKLLLMVLWETKSLDTKKYGALSAQMNEIGKMLGGWNGQLQKQNSPKEGEKRG